MTWCVVLYGVLCFVCCVLCVLCVVCVVCCVCCVLCVVCCVCCVLCVLCVVCVVCCVCVVCVVCVLCVCCVLCVVCVECGHPGWVFVGWLGRGNTTSHLLHHTSHTAPAHLLFPSLPGPVVGEMLSAARFVAVGMVGRPLTHVVRDAFLRGEGIAEVREQHGYPPTASAVRGVQR